VTSSLLRHRLECSLGDVPSDRSTFYYRYVGGFLADGWAGVVRVGPWRRTPERAFAAFLEKLAEHAVQTQDAEPPYSLADGACVTGLGPHDDRYCKLCDGAGTLRDGLPDEDPSEPPTCPACGGGKSAFRAEVVSAEQRCLSESDKIPETQPAPAPEKVH
jgi:hypothetical protein